MDASRLFCSLLNSLGCSTGKKNKSLGEAFKCGVFQMQLYAVSDTKGSRQLSILLTDCLPLTIGQAFNTLKNNTLEYFAGLLNIQVPLLTLMGGISQQYAGQMWGFQSALFFHHQKPLNGAEGASASEWHKWVLERAKSFDKTYPSELLPFSDAGVILESPPAWGYDVNDFSTIDRYIYKVWGYESSGLRDYIELAEYKACLIYAVYTSITSSRELTH